MFEKRPKLVDLWENGLNEIWEMAKRFGKWLAQLKHLRIGLTKLEMS